jgi:[acyl-carrier-protein] S-malonyltransferase
MAAACALEPTGMAAVLGGDTDEVLAAIEAAELYAANCNGAGQIVVAGSAEKLAKFAAQPPAGVRKVVALQVAGAFHTPYMAPAEEALAAVAAGVPAADPHKILLSNRDGTAVSSGLDMRQRLVAQVTAPVRWDLCMDSLADLGVTALIELPPAGTLAGLAKRALTGIEILTVNTPDDLAAAHDLVARHGVAPGAEPTPQFRVVVASSAGAFEPTAELAEGTEVRAGQVIGHVRTRQGIIEVTAHGSGVLTEWLAHHDDPVAAGQPLARIGGHL